MALKGDRNYGQGVDLNFYMNETAERGIVVVHDASVGSGSGAAMDTADAAVKKPDVANGSGELPVGVLLNDVVNYDLTRQHINWHKDEVQLGGKVLILRHGWVVTDMIESGVVVGPGLPAYFTTNGELNITSTNSTRVGTWMSAKDSDGFARLEVNMS